MIRARRAVVGRALTALVAVGVTAGLVAGCSSAAPPVRHSAHPAPATSISEPTSALPPSPTSNGPSHPSAPPPVTASSAPSTPTMSSTPTSPANSAPTTPAAPMSTCTSVTVRVIRGSADVGRELAALQFTNAGTRSCVLVGYPGATLIRNGKKFGTPAQPSTGKQSRRALAPGDTAESMLNDFTNCQAPLSDEVEVTVPGSTQTAVRPAQLRGCTLRVTALTAPQ